MKLFFHSPIFLGIVIFSVLAAVVYGMTLVGSPAEQRQLQFDQRRTSDLQQLASAIDTYWTQKDALPKGFDDLKNQSFTYIQSVRDPETGESYEYYVTGEKTYELCAVFATDSARYEMKTKTPFPFSTEQWNHAKGRACFAREVQSTSPIIR